jgi:hypothetical protein
MTNSEFSIYSIKNYDELPNFNSEHKYHIYFRGLFDRYGRILLKNIIRDELSCEINTQNLSSYVIKKLKNLYSFKHSCHDSKYLKIEYTDVLDFLFVLYNNSDSRYRDPINYKKYVQIFTEVNSISIPVCKIEKVNKKAITPTRSYISDIGYTIFIIKQIENISSKKIYIFDTGIRIKPALGFYISFLGTPELLKSGFMLKDNVYNYSKKDTIQIYLIKVDITKPKLILPFPCCKIILKKIHYYEII